jgi:hydrogenase expression/formation protein HypC
MCLGIVGRIVAMSERHPELADVDVAGVVRPIHVGILEEPVAPGDWLLIHAGFAMQKIDAATARTQLAALRDYSGPGDDGDEPDGRAP